MLVNDTVHDCKSGSQGMAICAEACSSLKLCRADLLDLHLSIFIPSSDWRFRWILFGGSGGKRGGRCRVLKSAGQLRPRPADPKSTCQHVIEPLHLNLGYSTDIRFTPYRELSRNAVGRDAFVDVVGIDASPYRSAGRTVWSYRRAQGMRGADDRCSRRALFRTNFPTGIATDHYVGFHARASSTFRRPASGSPGLLYGRPNPVPRHAPAV